MTNDDTPPLTIAFGILGAVFLLSAAGWGIRACSLAEKATFGAADQEVDRQVFEHSQIYREGLRRDTDELMLAYAKAKTDDERAVTLATLRHRVEGAPPEAVPADVKAFLREKTK